MSDEQIVFRGSPSIVTRFGSLFLGTLVLVGAIVGMIMVRQQQQGPWLIILGCVAAVAFIYILGIIWVVKSTQYEVTSERIRIRTGIMTKRTEELELYRATDTGLIEPLTMRMLGLGTIEIRTADASTPTVHLEAVHKARETRENLRKFIEECRDRKKVRMTEFDTSGPADASPST